MKERPINMKAWEVQAIRAGRKTQFRRVVNPQPVMSNRCGIPFFPDGSPVDYRLCPYGADGDRLWVRETWAHPDDSDGQVGYKATDEGEYSMIPRWLSPARMPRWASRIELELVSRRAERLNEISEEDAKAEGVQRGAVCDDAQCDDDFGPMNFVDGYQIAWESTNGPASWAENPFVWVVEFRVIKP